MTADPQAGLASFPIMFVWASQLLVRPCPWQVRQGPEPRARRKARLRVASGLLQTWSQALRSVASTGTPSLHHFWKMPLFTPRVVLPLAPPPFRGSRRLRLAARGSEMRARGWRSGGSTTLRIPAQALLPCFCLAVTPCSVIPCTCLVSLLIPASLSFRAMKPGDREAGAMQAGL